MRINELNPFTKENLVTRFLDYEIERNVFNNKTLEIMQNIDYKITINFQVPHPIDYTSITSLEITRIKKNNNFRYFEHKWYDKEFSRQLKVQDFNHLTKLSLQSNKPIRELYAIATLALKTKFDELRNSENQGMFYRSEFFHLITNNLLKNKVSFDTTVSDFYREQLPSNKANASQLNKFLFSKNEIYNLICWTTNNGIDKNKDKYEEKFWVLNIKPENIFINFIDYEDVPANLLKITLENYFFPRQSQKTKKETLENLELIKKGKTPIFLLSKIEQKARNSKISINDNKARIENEFKKHKIKANQKESMIGLNELRIKAEEYFKELRDDTYRKEKENENIVIIEKRKKNIATIIEKESYQEFMYRYYSVEDGNTNLYKVKIDNKCRTSLVLTKKEWYKKHYFIERNSTSYQEVKFDYKYPILPKEHVLKLMENLKNCCPKLWNDPIYFLNNLTFFEDRFSVEFSVQDYYNYRWYNGLIADELFDALVSNEFDVEYIIANKEELLPLRELFLPNLESFFTFNNRICAGGVGVLLAIANDTSDDFTITLLRRSDAVGESQHYLTVAPQGFHQSLKDKKEINLYYTVLREFYEELLNGKEVERRAENVRHNYYEYNDDRMKWLKENPESHKMELISHGIDMMTGNYIFGILWVIHDKKFMEKFGGELTKNWESKESERFDTLDQDEISELMNVSEWHPSSFQVFVEGMLRLKKLYENKVNLPNIKNLY